ncbi:MAG: 16S rRNA (cytosine(1402)-N(4))-methyltransferase RsmH [Gemmataceae bacterium]
MDATVSVRHVPVLPREVLHGLNPLPGQVLVDCTTGVGGHTRLLAERVAPTGQILALDQDATMLEQARTRLQGLPVRFIHASFDALPDVLESLGLACVDGILADLGICSDQLDAADRGFSFSREGPLDMRMNRQETETAAELLHRLPEPELADLIYRYGEERYSRRIAKRIVEQRQKSRLTTTTQLAELVRRCVPRSGGIDPATRTFQALRVAVNDELGALERLLAVLPRLLRTGGIAAIISFHSLEDRRVKQAIRNRDVWEELTRKPITAQPDEIAGNPRARSAKLRLARRK